jgi:flavin reductase (DIM6/NTAB) family NADH-FMN oxidoreductase RutF
MSFTKINIRDIEKSPVRMISDEWALVTAGNEKSWNTMTISWGGIGELWGKDVAFIFIRPQRYTYQFMENSDMFTLSFFDGKYKKELSYCGSKSGRDVNKSEQTGLTPEFGDGAVYISQADTVIVCRKIAFQDFNPKGFVDKGIEENYSIKDYHRIYIGEIVEVLKKDKKI